MDQVTEREAIIRDLAAEGVYDPATAVARAQGLDGSRRRTLPARWHTDPDVSDTDRRIGEALLTFNGPSGIWPGVPRLARIADVADRTVQRRLRHLESLGLVRSEPVFERPQDAAWAERGRSISNLNRQTTNRYALVAPGDVTEPAAQTPVTSSEPPAANVADDVDNVTPPGDMRVHHATDSTAAQTPVTSELSESAMSPLEQPRTNPQPGSGKGVLQPVGSTRGREDQLGSRAGLRDLTGRRFGRLLVLGLAPRAEQAGKGRQRWRFWRCRCDCGAEHLARTADLTAGLTVSCGCRRREAARATGKRAAKPVTWAGQTRTPGEWEQITGIPASLIRSRLGPLGWSVERALSTPARRTRRRSAR